MVRFSNHYRFVAHSPPMISDATSLSAMLSVLHVKTAEWVNKLDNAPGRQVWHNFWDTRLTHQTSYLARLNYVHQNAVKHDLVPVASQYPWCSAGWFERTASPAMVKAISRFKFDSSLCQTISSRMQTGYKSARGLAHSKTLREIVARPDPRQHPGVRRPSAAFERTLRTLIDSFIDSQSNATHLSSAAMIRLILFDIDGTLVHTGGAGVKAFAKVFATEFGATDGFERLKFAGRTDVSLVREFFEFHKIPATPANFERFFDQYVFWLDHILAMSKTETCPGVWEFIYDVRALPNPPLLGLLTGNIRLGAEIKLRHFDLWNVFETGGFADDSEDRGAIAAAACERGSRVLGETLSGDQVLVIGDTPLDIKCARAVNAKVLAVATGGATLEELVGTRPDWAAEDLRRINVAEVCG